MTRQDWTGHDKMKEGKIGWDKLGRSHLDRTEQDWKGRDRTIQDLSGSCMTVFERMG